LQKLKNTSTVWTAFQSNTRVHTLSNDSRGFTVLGICN